MSARGGRAGARARCVVACLSACMLACMAASARPAHAQGEAGPAGAPAAETPRTPDDRPHTATPDTAAPEAALPEAATPDAGTSDAATPEAGTPDAGTAVELPAPAAATPDARTLPGHIAEPSPVMRPGVWATLGALFPGVLVHGTGHRIGGDARTANRLLRGQLVALGIAAAGGVPLALTGASRRLSLPTIPLIVGGGGMLLLGWGADVYGATGLGRVAGTPRLSLPGLEVRLGHLYVHDPQFAYRSFANPGARLRWGAWHADLDLAVALGDDNQRVRVEGGRRWLGPRATGRARDGSALGLDAAVTAHRYGSDGFTSLLGEVMGRGRYDLARVAPSLAGAFAELWLGLGLETVIYEGEAADVSDWMLGGFGFGMYLGRPAATHGEVRVYYDHFRGDLAGGLAVPGGAAGYWGRVGIDGFVAFHPRWGVSLRAEIGSAYLAGVGLVYRRP